MHRSRSTDNAVAGENVAVVSRRGTPVRGAVEVPADKSITHRALFFGALSNRRVLVRNPSPALDCLSTRRLLETLGYRVADNADGFELGPVASSSVVSLHNNLILDCGNSGTTARLAAGFLTGERGEFTLVGDESLSKRPMRRVAEPLSAIGGEISATGGAFPVSVVGSGGLHGNAVEPIEVRSAQVHGALTLAGLRSAEGLLLRRTAPMRDHTLRICAALGFPIRTDGDLDRVLPLATAASPTAVEFVELRIPGDISSASFLIAAALLIPESDLTVTGVGLNPTRIAFPEALRRMGADISWSVEREWWEPAGTVRVRYTPGLHGVDFSETTGIAVEHMMDELPLLALVASQAEGETVVHGAGELRVKESDRIAATAELLGSIGIDMEEFEDGFRVAGRQRVRGAAEVRHCGDHRLAMMGAVAGLIASEPVAIPDPEVVGISWPGFLETLAGLN